MNTDSAKEAIEARKKLQELCKKEIVKIVSTAADQWFDAVINGYDPDKHTLVQNPFPENVLVTGASPVRTAMAEKEIEKLWEDLYAEELPKVLYGRAPKSIKIDDKS